MKPNRIGKYGLLDHIGYGTIANVWLTKDPDMGRQVALKVVEPETTDLEPFFKEARLLARLAHPNIVTIHGCAQIEGKVVIDIEYVPGGSLWQALQSVNQALKITAQVLNALSYAHSAGIVHRDLKPPNLSLAGYSQRIARQCQ